MSQLSTKRIERGFSWAKEASLNSDFHQHHLGAAIVYRGSLLATGFNSNKTSPIQKKFNRERNFDVNASYAVNSLHAECACLNKIKYLDIDFSKAVLFVYREHKNGHKALAKPCPACEKFIRNLGIKEVYYTTEQGWEHSHQD